jgi:hypothetical protein
MMVDHDQALMMFDRLEAGMAELRAYLVERAEAGEQPPAPPPAKRKEKWVGPVPEEIRRQREEKHTWRFWLCVALERDASIRAFAGFNNLPESECSRHTTRKDRCIPPGCVRDVNITKALDRAIASMEGELVKNHGSTEIITRLRAWVFGENASHEPRKRNARGAAKHRASLRGQVQGKSCRTPGR